MSRTTVMVLSDDRLFSDALSRIVEDEPSLCLAGADVSPEVVLIDSRMPGAFSLCAAETATGSAVIIVAAPDDDGYALSALEAGARGLLPRTAQARDVVTAVSHVSQGMIWARRRVISARLDELTCMFGRKRDAIEKRLSVREREVFRHAVTGLGNKQVADLMMISEATVKVHLTHIFQKLGIASRAELAAAYFGLQRQPATYDERISPSR